MEEPILVTTTVERRDHAEHIARVLLTKRLVACAQVYGPITSMYWWQGDLAESTEYVVTLKTFAALYPSVETTIRSAHPYDVPEVVGQPLTRVSEGYLAWMREEIAG